MSVEDGLLRILHKRRFPGPRYAFIRGVSEATGLPGRRADAVAMSCWPSDGYLLHGIEAKSSRRDWLRELRQPDKAEQIARYCDYWWVVVPEGLPDIVHAGELPDGWGLLEVTRYGDRITTVRKAPLRTPLPLSRQFLAALLRTAKQMSPVNPEAWPADSRDAPPVEASS